MIVRWIVIGTASLAASAIVPAHPRTPLHPASSAAPTPAPPAAAPAPKGGSPSPTTPPPSKAADARPKPDPRACIERARAARTEAGENVDAVRTAYQALRTCVSALLEAGDTKEALQAAEAGNDIFFQEAQSGYDYGAVILLTNGDPDRAKAAIEAGLKRREPAAPSGRAERALALNNLGKIEMGKGNLTAARERFQEAMRSDSSFAGLFYNLAEVVRRLGDAAECATSWEAGYSRDPALATAEDYRNAAWAYDKLGRPANSAAILHRALAVAPHEPGLHLDLGRALAKQQRPLDALLEYEYEVLNAASGDPLAVEADKLFTEGLDSPSGTTFDVQRTVWLRTAALAKGPDRKEAMESLERLKNANLHHPVLDHYRALSLLATGRKTEAEGVLRASIESDPSFLAAYYDLAALLAEKGKMEESRKLVSEAAQRNPLHPRLIGDAGSGTGGTSP